MSGSAMDDTMHKLIREQEASYLHSVISVQPMTQPLASIFYLDIKYGKTNDGRTNVAFGPKLVQGYLFDDR